MAVRLAGSGTTSLHFTFTTGSKWVVAFRLPDLDEVYGVSRDNRFVLRRSLKEKE